MKREINCVFFQDSYCRHPETLIASRFNSFYRNINTAANAEELANLIKKATTNIFINNVQETQMLKNRRELVIEKIIPLGTPEVRGLIIDFLKQMDEIWQLRQEKGRCTFDYSATEIMLATCGGRVATEQGMSSFETSTSRQIDYHSSSILADKKSANLILGWFEEELGVDKS